MLTTESKIKTYTDGNGRLCTVADLPMYRQLAKEQAEEQAAKAAASDPFAFGVDSAKLFRGGRKS